MKVDFVINEKFGLTSSDIPDGMFRFEVVSYREMETNRGEPCLVVKVRLDNNMLFEIPFLLTTKNTGRLCEFFVAVGVKIRGVPIKVSEAIENLDNKSGYVMVKDGLAYKFFNFSDVVG